MTSIFHLTDLNSLYFLSIFADYNIFVMIYQKTSLICDLNHGWNKPACRRTANLTYMKQIVIMATTSHSLKIFLVKQVPFSMLERTCESDKGMNFS